MPQGRPADKLSIRLEDLGGQCRSNVSRRSEVASKDEFGIGVSRGVIPEHDPVIPSKLADVADVSSTTSHYGLRHFAIGHIDVIAR